MDKKELISNKRNDTVVIYGSGRSLTEHTEEQWQELREYDSIGFNWFVIQDWINPNYMIVGDIRPEKTLKFSGQKMSETYNKYSEYSNKDNYKNSIFVVFDDQTEGLPKEFLTNKKIHTVSKSLEFDISDIGKIYKNKSTLFAALDLAMSLGYKNIIFAGVDLYDYRFFWLPEDTTRSPGQPTENPKWANRAIGKKHPIHKKTFSWFDEYRTLVKESNVKLYCYNPKSLLLQEESVVGWK